MTEMPSVGSFSPRVVLRHSLGLDFGFLIACSCWLRHRSSEFNRNLSLTDASHQLNVLRWVLTQCQVHAIAGLFLTVGCCDWLN